ncbi:RNA-binding protein S4 [Rhodobacteraceae bacterium WD3A24]|nr:RNA-binding protein S4 [Rhodobacteraceae bacterium WD3A24]
MRLDKWLWQARFFKTRGLAAKVAAAGQVRVNAARVSKPAQAVRPGDTLTFPQGRHVRVVRVVALGTRRGPADEARTLYDDLSPPQPTSPAEAGRPAPHLGGRPEKRARRRLERFRGSDTQD